MELNNGKNIPEIGVGTWQLVAGDKMLEILECAYKAGYRHIDTASCYGNEDTVGEFLSRHRRDELFITTKLWNSDHEDVMGAIKNSLERLRTNYVDLYLIHWPVNFNGVFDVERVWRQMEELVTKGKARCIGVSNFGVKNLTKLLAICKIKPVVNQIELHPYLPQHEIRDLCKKNKIQVIAYSPLGSSSGSRVVLSNDAVLKQIAQTHDCPVQSVILSYLILEGIAVIPRSQSPEHIISNIRRIQLTGDEMARIREIKTRHRYVDPKEFGEDRFD